MPKKRDQKIIVTLDPSMQMRKMVHLDGKNMGWHLFKGIYWSVYLFVIGLVMFVSSINGYFNTIAFFGSALIMLSLFVLVYGIVYALHIRLMKRYV